MTLTQTAILTKRIILISSVALVLGITSFIGYKIWYAYYLAHLPPIEEKPDIKFGSLPQPDFPKSSVSSSNFSYSLDTATGGLPRVGLDKGFEKIIKVYFITKTFTTFLSSDRSQELAKKFGIESAPEVLTETKYRFTDKNKSLTVDLDNGNFSYTKEASVSGKINLDDDNRLILSFNQILSSLGVFKKDLQNGRSKIIMLRSSGSNFIPTQLRTEAEAVQISLWPASIDNKAIYSPNFNSSLINGVITGSADNLENYLSLDFTYYTIDTSTFATYPSKTAETAFEDLKTGKGVVIIEPDKPQVSITSVYLGYFMPENYGPYLQPIYIFEGPNFVAYVSAITEQYQTVAK